ncbi:hypothetical protein SAMN05428969_0564 [Devosia sp. YR412]|uniref:hypothetical protein n=1 Tax=Devosia sp. YR412 TaxID=1881030 RepID=UPI0008D6F9B5|nr:hypothetical protein [Devosia sp. YR412]SEP70960.1 hypothetical protein SAMN05428969_0564 [Devosia sp. YR412]
MKLKSLILGSIAAAGLSTAGFAADLGVLTSLDVCDELGLSGLTISSDTNCLQISGSVSYTYEYGNFNNSGVVAAPVITANFGGVNADGSTSVDAPSFLAGVSNQDWNSKVETLLKFVGTASSDFGPARVVINLRQRDYTRARDGIAAVDGDAHALRAQDAYVQVGDTTILSAGKKGSIFNEGDDEPFNFTGLFISKDADAGVWEGPVRKGGHVIQLESQFGEGIVGKIGLEALDRVDVEAGSLIGVLEYAGEGVTAHVSGSVGGLANGWGSIGDSYAVHAGVTGTFDAFKLRAAGSFGGLNNGGAQYARFFNGLVSGEAKFDMFKVALSAEIAGGNDNVGADVGTDYGFGGSIGATVAEGVEINLGGRYFNDGTAGVADGYQVAAQIVAALTETVKLTGEVGVFGLTPAPAAPAFSSDFYAKAELGWTPGGGFSSSVGATVQQNGAYKVTFKAAKAFQ